MTESKAPPDECVGSLLIHQRDMLDLSASSSKTTHNEAVGTLLVSQSDMKELSHHEVKAACSDGTAVDGTTAPSQSNLIRRITKTMMGPPPDDDQCEIWAD